MPFFVDPSGGPQRRNGTNPMSESLTVRCRLCKRQFTLGSDAVVVTLEAMIQTGCFDDDDLLKSSLHEASLRQALARSAGTFKNPDQVFPQDYDEMFHPNVAPFKTRPMQNTQIESISEGLGSGADRYWKCNQCDAINRYKKTIISTTAASGDRKWWRFW